MRPVKTKTDMYRRLTAGEFGNTIKQYFDIEEWAYFSSPAPFWGVRTMTPGGPCRLNCPAMEVAATAEGFESAGHKVNISLMVDTVATVTAWLEVWDSPTGLVVEGIEYPDTAGGWTWRNSMPDPAKRRRWEGVLARMVLKRHLNADSYDDVWRLIEDYPDHVLEFSTLDRNMGTVPGRRHIVWEIRQY